MEQDGVIVPGQGWGHKSRQCPSVAGQSAEQLHPSAPYQPTRRAPTEEHLGRPCDAFGSFTVLLTKA